MSGNRYFLSVYALAVKHGFQGTEKDFLKSLIGPEGPRGLQGIKGFSPQVRVGVIEGGHRISITYEDEDRDNALVDATFDVLDGLTVELDDTLTTPGKAADAAAVGEALKNAPFASAVKYTPQNLSPAEKAQARKNIGAGLDAPNYYHTEREELGVSHDYINKHGADYVYGLYDALMTKYPDYVQMKELESNDGTKVLREYVVTYNTDGYYTDQYEPDDPARKPKYLIMSGIHGSERKAVFSTYRFIRDVLNGHNVPDSFRNGVVLHVLPVANPTGFKANSYENEDGVNINRNFDWDWEVRDGSGDDAMSELETQAIANWMADNKDAVAFIDCHNSIILNENVMISGSPDNDEADRVKRAAMRGVDRIIPYWRDVIGYKTAGVPIPDENGYAQRDENGKLLTKQKPVIFSYSVTANIKGGAFNYAQNVVGIPSISLEMLTYYGDARTMDEEEAEGIYKYQPEVIAMGAEAIGNILVELFSEASEVKDMALVGDKLDTLAESMNSMSKGFRIESGTMTLDADVLPAEGTSKITVKLRDDASGMYCPGGAKMFVFYADSTTLTAIKNMYKQVTDTFTPPQYVGTVLGNCFEPNIANYSAGTLSYMSQLQYVDTLASWHKGWVLANSVTTANSADGVSFSALALKAGTYHWTAYYWNE